MMRFLAFSGVMLTLILSVWYTIKTYKDGDTKWIYLIMAFGIAILLTTNLIGPRKQKD